MKASLWQWLSLAVTLVHAETCLPACPCKQCVYRGADCIVCKDRLVVLVLACNRTAELKVALTALAAADGAEDVEVVVSVDCPAPPIASEAGDAFASFDVVASVGTAGNAARHWLGALTRAFRAYDAERILLVEEDHVVMPDIFTAAALFQPCKSCFATNLAHHHGVLGTERAWGLGGIGNIGVVYYRDRWERFLRQGLDRFCSLRGDWDHAMQRLRLESRWGVEPDTLQVYKPRAYHLKTCFSAREKKRKTALCGDRKREYAQFLQEWNSSNIGRRGLSTLLSPWPMPAVPAPKAMQELCLNAVRAASSPRDGPAVAQLVPF